MILYKYYYCISGCQERLVSTFPNNGIFLIFSTVDIFLGPIFLTVYDKFW